MKPGDIVHCIAESCRGYIPFSDLTVSKLLHEGVVEVMDAKGKTYLELRQHFAKGKSKQNSNCDYQYRLSDLSDPKDMQARQEVLKFFPELAVYRCSGHVAFFDGAKIKIPEILLKYSFHEIVHFLECDLKEKWKTDNVIKSDIFRPDWGLGMVGYEFEDQRREERVGHITDEYFHCYPDHPEKAKEFNRLVVEKYKKFWPDCMDRPIFHTIMGS